MESWLGVSDLDLIFKVTARLNPPNLSQKVFAYYLMDHEITCKCYQICKPI